ncbi:ABC transporter ATP-binding protein [Saccharothrix coeruleofusca]|uniref:ABC transporter ATP-binding protein n=1 Tax=Saccharothrix coeruleofusca TaxID=33919 RepID=A0A918ASJ5_9PSEU|nr:ABC transporter ATP-binding protein [Saccharothrix coeruleofusca]MBP2339138.1 ABC-2 type transport system ATP-binding protein [Saccharothrix coeruleofusca]GGP70216.1 ABC transporter ATP-binding protein [Saccharothrix coeruleofusca]
MTTVVEPVEAAATAVRAQALGKRYKDKWALRDCTFELPAGRVAALVGANGAGKTTLMTVLAGLLRPDEGAAGVAGRVAFVSQEKPVYRHFTVAEMLRMGARLNTVWDQDRAGRWLERFEIPLDRPCGRLSGGQQAQVAFAVAIGSRPDVLMLDEPLANLDPLARREVTAELLGEVAETGMTVLLSTHVVAELGGVADHLLLLAHGRLLAGGDLDELLARHVVYTGPRSDVPPALGKVVEARHRGGQSTFLVELPEGRPRPVVAGQWAERPVTLEDYVLAQLAATRKGLKG